MKREGFIFPKICAKENIILAIYNSSKGKRGRRNVQRILKKSVYYASQIQQMLVNKTYVPAGYQEEKIWDGGNKKERTIFKPQYYPDQIIHWCLMQQIEPLIRRGMYDYCCASVPGRGIHYTLKTVKKWLKEDHKYTKYCVKMDIKKFYPSIDRAVLKGQFRRKIKDPDTLWLIETIIDSHKQGLPIGNYTSQWFSNFYLEGFDHYVKEVLGVKYYIRYMDDFCLFGNNKKKLHQARSKVEQYLQEVLHLQLKDNWQLFCVDERGVDFVGYRIFRDYCLLRKSTALRISRRMRKIRARGEIKYKDAAAFMSYLGWLKHCQAYNFTQKHLVPVGKIEEIKDVIRAYS
ncbi:MAG: RNA-directed DNA polymerase [Peptococcia bacterium]